MDTVNVSVSNEMLAAYEFAYENKITEMPTVTEAKVDKPIKRNELAKMLTEYAVNVM